MTNFTDSNGNTLQIGDSVRHIGDPDDLGRVVSFAKPSCHDYDQVSVVWHLERRVSRHPASSLAIVPETIDLEPVRTALVDALAAINHL